MKIEFNAPTLEQLSNYFKSVNPDYTVLTSGITTAYVSTDSEFVVKGLSVIEEYGHAYDDIYHLICWEFHPDGSMYIRTTFEYYGEKFEWLEDADEKMCEYHFKEINE